MNYLTLCYYRVVRSPDPLYTTDTELSSPDIIIR